MSKKYMVLDFETTGLEPQTAEITEVGILIADENFEKVEGIESFVKIQGEVPEFITEITGITKEDTEKGLSLGEIKDMIQEYLMEDLVVVCQHAAFDLSFMSLHMGIDPEEFVCTRALSTIAEPFESASLGKVCERHNIKNETAHRALSDCYATLEVLKLRKEQGFYVENAVVESKDRPLTFVPKYNQTIISLEDVQEQMENRENPGGHRE